MDLTSLQDWTTAKRATTDDPDHRRAFDGLALLLSNQASPAMAATTITEAYESFIKDTPITHDNDKISVFWALFLCDAIRTFGSAHQRLVELLREVSKQPDVTMTDGSLAKHSNGAVYWRDLPGWPLQLCEVASSPYLIRHLIFDPADNFVAECNEASEHYPDEADEYFAQAPYFLNSSRFAATLLEEGHEVFLLDLTGPADASLRQGVENPYDSTHEVVSREWKVLLPAAATWLLIAGKKVYQTCLDEDEGSRRSTGRRNWSRQMWEDWKEMLQKLSDREDIDEESRSFAARAGKKMAEVELEHQA